MSTPEPQYFFIIGAMKAGTTSLYKYLKDHPEVYASPRKEPEIFSVDGEPRRQRREFLQLFEERAQQLWCFEASTAYTKFPHFSDVPRRIQAAVPDAKFVYLVRNPVDRAWSQYVHNLAHGRETRSFVDAIAASPEYLNISRYNLQLGRYLQVFPQERILVRIFEEMVADPLTTVRDVCAFLGVAVAYAPPTSDVAFNASSTKIAASAPLRMVRTLGMYDIIPWRIKQWMRNLGEPLPEKQAVLTPDLRGRLADALRPDIEAFFRTIGRRVDAWRDFR